MGSGGRRDTTGSIWCRACTQDCLLFISFALGRFTYWGQNGFEIAYTSKLRQNVQEREKFKNDHGTFQFLPHMGGFQLVIQSITTLILHVTHYKIGVLSLVELFGDIKKLIDFTNCHGSKKGLETGP